MAKGNNNQNQGADEFLLFFGCVLLILAILYLLPKYQWIFFEYWRYSRIMQFTLFSWIDLSFFNGMEEVRHTLLNDNAFTNIYQIFNTEGNSSERLSQLNSQYWAYIKEVDSMYTKYFSWASALFVVYLGIKVIRSTSSITKFYNFELLLSNYAKAKPYYGDLIGKNKRPDLISFNEAVKRGIINMTPYEFATMSPPPGLTENRPIYDPEAEIFDEKLAQKAFDIQLGNRWRGVDHLTKEEKYFYDSLKIIVEKKLKKNAEDIMNKHAYVYTGLKTLYIESKKTGVVAPSWFRDKIKYKNTYLWRMISDSGRLPLAMGAGITVHHNLEVSLGEPVEKPATEEAVYALAETIGYDEKYLSMGALAQNKKK